MARLMRARAAFARFRALGLVAFPLLTGCTNDLVGPAPSGAGAQGATTGGTGPAGAAGAGASTGATTNGGGTSGSGAGGAGGVGGSAGSDAPTPPAPGNPGMVTLRRLNRVEYDNTVRDLLGTALRPAENFQADAAGAGYDTVGAALSLPPAAVRDYEAAAYALVDDVLADPARAGALVACDVDVEGEPCVRATLTPFVRRAFRRPVTTAELDRLVTPFRTAEMLGATRREGLRHSLAAVLVNPSFLFKHESDPDPTSSAPRRLDDHEIATRLSYALWSSMPDDALFGAADAGTLKSDSELDRQIERMLADPRAAALSQHFAGQWLDIRSLNHEPDARAFPDYTPALYAAMRNEASHFFASFMASARPLGELLNARFTYVDATLANHYGLPVPSDMAPGDMRLADTSGVERSGILTLGAVLTATSMTTRTSPVKRGAFVLRRLLCETITPPPPDVIGIPDELDPTEGLTMRQRMERHRENPACEGCHVDMDQLGFGLENYDAVGRYRTSDNGSPVDSAGVLPDGSTFSGAVTLASLLSRDARFNQCLTKNLMTYVLGRTLDQRDDAVWILHVAGSARDQGGTLGALLRSLLRSEAFRSRQAVILR